jgi:hypothetical protein
MNNSLVVNTQIFAEAQILEERHKIQTAVRWDVQFFFKGG